MSRRSPRNIVMLGFAGAQILDIVGPMQILAAVNDERPAGAAAYRLTLLAARRGPFRTSGGLSLVADGAYRNLPTAIDTLIVAGGGPASSSRDPALTAALKRGAKRARRVVSICTGAFYLAEAGCLAGKRATSHWRFVDQLAREFPDVAVERDAIYVRDGKYWSSAGVTAGMDLALALVREDYGDDMALTVARRHVLFLMRPGGQSQFSAHLSPDAYPQGRLGSLLRWIPEHVGEDLDVSTLARRANMSERSFARIFASETGETPARHIERARLDAARRLLTGSDLPVGSVAARAGFGSEERMRRAFRRRLNVNPGAFRERFRAEGETQ
jgi:transcriptional regulator GlxA family with amidase domain